jgi:hypothetical protein
LIIDIYEVECPVHAFMPTQLMLEIQMLIRAFAATGMANATTGGWGNVGAGIAQVLMPVVYNAMTSMHEPFVAWRFAMFIPGFMHILGGILILFFSTDLPDGNYAMLKKSGAMTKENPVRVMMNALCNYRYATVVAAPHACGCFGRHAQCTNTVHDR